MTYFKNINLVFGTSTTHDFSLESLGAGTNVMPLNNANNNLLMTTTLGFPVSINNYNNGTNFLNSNGTTMMSNITDVHELLAVRAHLDQLEVKESVEAQLQRISVPLSLVLLTMLAYLVAGAIIFCFWENWTFLDSFYFCYISLTTIGILFN